MKIDMFTGGLDFVERVKHLVNKVCEIDTLTNWGQAKYKCIVYNLDINNNGRGTNVIDQYGLYHHYTWYNVVSIEELNVTESILFKLENDL